MQYSSGQVRVFVADFPSVHSGKESWMLAPEVTGEKEEEKKRKKELKVAVETHTHVYLLVKLTFFALRVIEKTRDDVDAQRTALQIGCNTNFRAKDTQSRASLDTGRHGRCLVVPRRQKEREKGWL